MPRSVGGTAQRLRNLAAIDPYKGFVKQGQIMAPSQSWEANQQQDPKLYLINGVWYAFHAAESGDGHMKIGYRTATPSGYPTTWTPYAGNPILVHGEQSGVDDVLVSAPVLVPMLDGSFRLYYHAYGAIGGVSADRACVATCSATEFPNTWHKYAGNPILDVGTSGQWDDGYIHNEIIIPPWFPSPDGLWHMLYGGGDRATGNIWRGGHATSTDGLSWTKDARNPTFRPSELGFDSFGVHPVGQPWLIGGLYHIVFQGYDNTTWAVGEAVSTDLVTLVRSPRNPLVVRGGTGQWDAGSVENPGTVYDSSTGQVDLFYVSPPTFSGGQGGTGGTNYKIGLSRSTP